jgi:hypothetical protein
MMTHSTRRRYFPVAILIGGLSLLLTGSAFAQAPSFSSLGSPTSPAFTLLDVGASTIERPATPADFAVKLGNATERFSAPQQQFAIEAAPYWLFPRPRLSWSEDAVRDPLTSLVRTFTFSAATAPLGLSDESLTGLAIAFSASPFSGKLTDSTKAKIRGLESTLSSISAQFDSRVRERREALRSSYLPLLANAATDRERDRIREELELRSAALNEIVRDEIADEIAERLAPFDGFEPRREGLFMTFAGGSAWVFPNAIVDQGALAQWGIWGTVSYQTGPWSPTLVLRYLNRRENTPLANSRPDGEVVDVGARMIYTAGAFGVSGEYVLRRSLDSEDAQYRLVGALEYNVNERLWLIASFGRSHEPAAAGSLVAQLGLAFNFSRDRYSLPQ